MDPNAKRDANYVPSLLGINSSDPTTTAPAAVDPITNRLLVTAVITSGGTSGTEYTEGDTDATLTGSIAMAEGPANTVIPLQVDASKHLQVDIAADSVGIGGGVQYTEADTDVSITGTAIMWEDTSDTLRAVSASKPLPVDLQDTTVAVTQSGTWDEVGINDSGNSITVDDGGSSLTVDGTVGVSGTVTVDSELTTADLDTGAGTDTRAVVGLVGSKSGGGVLIPGDATAGLKVDLGADNDVTITSGTVTTITNVVHVDDNSSSLTVDGSVTATAVGDIASGATDSGNPVKVAGKYNATRPTFTDGQRGDLQIGSRGSLGTTLFVSDSTTPVALAVTNADGVAAASVASRLETSSRNYVFNGSTWDRQRGDTVGSFATGSIADDATTPDKPVMIGGTAKETDGTDPGSVSAEDDVTRVITDRNRRLLVNTFHPRMTSATENNATAQTNNPILSAPGASLSLYITDIVVSNGATAGSIRFVEDTGGTPVIKVQETYMAVNGGAVMNFTTPIRITANKDFGYTSTTVTTHSITVNGFIAP